MGQVSIPDLSHAFESHAPLEQGGGDGPRFDSGDQCAQFNPVPCCSSPTLSRIVSGPARPDPPGQHVAPDLVNVSRPTPSCGLTRFPAEN